MSLLLERVRALKREGNDCFNAGNRRYGTDEGNDALQHACVLYGQAIEAVMELEVEMDSAAPVEDIRPCSSTAAEAVGDDDESASSVARTEEGPDADLSGTKIALFLNLAQANILLGNFDGAMRCCNAAVQLCNAPSLPLAELAPSDEHVDVLLPVPPHTHALAAKALFRRGKCYSELGEDGRAMGDFHAANRLVPHNKQILDSLSEAGGAVGKVESRSDYCPSAASAVSAASAAVSAWGGGRAGNESAGAPATVTTAANSTRSGSSSAGDEGDGVAADDGEVDSCTSFSSACTAATATATAAAASVAAAGGIKQQHPRPPAPPPPPPLPLTAHSVGNRAHLRPAATGATFSVPPELTTNGGHCWLRRGYWSQTVADAVVHLPLALFKGRHAADAATTHDDFVVRQQWKVEFRRMAVVVTFQPPPSGAASPGSSSSSSSGGGGGGAGKAVTLPLEHIIVSSECTWTLDRVGDRPFLVLHLSKAPSVEWFPGCEWWDRVCAGDEAIDTMTCTVGADTVQLPPEARAAAERESRRFTDLSAAQRREELDRLTRAKQGFAEAERRTRAAADEEDAAACEVPERGEMLEKLREAFPSIDFRAK